MKLAIWVAIFTSVFVVFFILFYQRGTLVSNKKENDINKDP